MSTSTTARGIDTGSCASGSSQTGSRERRSDVIDRIVSRAATLQERLQEARRRPDARTRRDDLDAAGRKRLARLRDEVTDGDVGFERLLDLLSTTEEQFYWALGADRSVEEVDDRWRPVFEAVCDYAPVHLDRLRTVGSTAARYVGTLRPTTPSLSKTYWPCSSRWGASRWRSGWGRRAVASTPRRLPNSSTSC